MAHFYTMSPAELSAIVLSPSQPLSDRMSAVYALRNLASDEAIDAMSDAMFDESALLAHEIAYCIGQTRNAHGVPALEKVLRDEGVDSMVRHEAAEAMGAIGCGDAIGVLEEYSTHALSEISETCEVALDLIKWKLENQGSEDANVGKEVYFSVDPAPPLEGTVEELKEILNDQNKSIFKRYRALFGLRNIGTEEAVLAICSSLNVAENGHLFQHEVAYVLGQLQHPASLEALTEAFLNKSNHGMVRHEAAEAIGSLPGEEAVALLTKHLEDEEVVVRESCRVALDIHEENE
eukprot:TRINITY_DN12778_c0_g1_i2.p1 TRINITY_DN12778_c0_g1~~TRINITY_DN12778_c0_g1_i2.p1  ORF type:complete len:292 (+),score=78.51 TRINITY_DN12778_c0_g1_i2:57-932(+)